MCCNVLDSIGGAESYSVSVSCVGSPASVQGLDSVPAPQSQKNLQHRETALSGHSLLLQEQPHAPAGNVPIMSNEFYVVSLMALLDAVHTDGVTVCGVAGVTSGGKSSSLGRNQNLTRSQGKCSRRVEGQKCTKGKRVHRIVKFENFTKTWISQHIFCYLGCKHSCAVQPLGLRFTETLSFPQAQSEFQTMGTCLILFC